MSPGEVRSRTVLVYEPVADESRNQDALAGRLASLDGKLVGLLDNTKDLVEVLLGEVKSLLQQDYARVTFRYFRKPSVSGADPDLMEQLGACDAVVTAVGD